MSSSKTKELLTAVYLTGMTNDTALTAAASLPSSSTATATKDRAVLFFRKVRAWLYLYSEWYLPHLKSSVKFDRRAFLVLFVSWPNIRRNILLWALALIAVTSPTSTYFMKLLWSPLSVDVLRLPRGILAVLRRCHLRSLFTVLRGALTAKKERNSSSVSAPPPAGVDGEGSPVVLATGEQSTCMLPSTLRLIGDSQLMRIVYVAQHFLVQRYELSANILWFVVSLASFVLMSHSRWAKTMYDTISATAPPNTTCVICLESNYASPTSPNPPTAAVGAGRPEEAVAGGSSSSSSPQRSEEDEEEEQQRAASPTLTLLAAAEHSFPLSRTGTGGRSPANEISVPLSPPSSSQPPAAGGGAGGSSSSALWQRLSCGHYLHTHCCRQWLQTKNCCPHCQRFDPLEMCDTDAQEMKRMRLHPRTLWQMDKETVDQLIVIAILLERLRLHRTLYVQSVTLATALGIYLNGL